MKQAIISTALFVIVYLGIVAVGRFLLHGDVFWKAGFGI